jgi:hypothetical protein
MKKVFLTSLMAMFCMSLLAQTNEIELVKGHPFIVSNPSPGAKKKATVVWPSTENSWIKDSCQFSKVPVEKDFYTHLFTESYVKEYAAKDETTVMAWRLTDNGTETILHCYFPMKTDQVSNLWVGSNETAIVDRETGVQYRAKRSEPDCMRKHLTVKGKAGDVLDLQIFFPRLPEDVHKISIYGVPNWYLGGGSIYYVSRPMAISADHHHHHHEVHYDTVPQFHKPHLVKDSVRYDRNNHETWPVYNDAHLIKPTEEGKIALWLTPEATYLAVSHEQNWNREYFGDRKDQVLIDSKGHQYRLLEVVGLPVGTLYWIEGKSGDFNATLLKFEPLPLNLKEFTYFDPEGTKFDMWGANWSGRLLTNLKVDELRANQSLFQYLPRKVSE